MIINWTYATKFVKAISHYYNFQLCMKHYLRTVNMAAEQNYGVTGRNFKCTKSLVNQVLPSMIKIMIIMKMIIIIIISKILYNKNIYLS